MEPGAMIIPEESWLVCEYINNHEYFNLTHLAHKSHVRLDKYFGNDGTVKFLKALSNSPPFLGELKLRSLGRGVTAEPGP